MLRSQSLIKRDCTKTPHKGKTWEKYPMFALILLLSITHGLGNPNPTQGIKTQNEMNHGFGNPNQSIHIHNGVQQANWAQTQVPLEALYKFTIGELNKNLQNPEMSEEFKLNLMTILWDSQVLHSNATRDLFQIKGDHRQVSYAINKIAQNDLSTHDQLKKEQLEKHLKVRVIQETIMALDLNPVDLGLTSNQYQALLGFETFKFDKAFMKAPKTKWLVNPTRSTTMTTTTTYQPRVEITTAQLQTTIVNNNTNVHNQHQKISPKLVVNMTTSVKINNPRNNSNITMIEDRKTNADLQMDELSYPVYQPSLSNFKPQEPPKVFHPPIENEEPILELTNERQIIQAISDNISITIQTNKKAPYIMVATDHKTPAYKQVNMVVDSRDYAIDNHNAL